MHDLCSHAIYEPMRTLAAAWDSNFGCSNLARHGLAVSLIDLLSLLLVDLLLHLELRSLLHLDPNVHGDFWQDHRP